MHIRLMYYLDNLSKNNSESMRHDNADYICLTDAHMR